MEFIQPAISVEHHLIAFSVVRFFRTTHFLPFSPRVGVLTDHIQFLIRISKKNENLYFHGVVVGEDTAMVEALMSKG